MLRAALVSLLFWLAPAIASAAPCAARDDLLEKLAANFDEVPVGVGLTWDGRVLEIVASGDGSWTILITNPDGMTCGVASGEAWSRPLAPTRRPGGIES